MLSKSSSTGLFESDISLCFSEGLRHTIPAAPAPMMTTFFLVSLPFAYCDESSDDILLFSQDAKILIVRSTLAHAQIAR